MWTCTKFVVFTFVYVEPVSRYLICWDERDSRHGRRFPFQRNNTLREDKTYQSVKSSSLLNFISPVDDAHVLIIVISSIPLFPSQLNIFYRQQLSSWFRRSEHRKQTKFSFFIFLSRGSDTAYLSSSSSFANNPLFTISLQHVLQLLSAMHPTLFALLFSPYSPALFRDQSFEYNTASPPCYHPTYHPTSKHPLSSQVPRTFSILL